MYMINGLPFTSKEIENGRKALLDILLILKEYNNESSYVKYDDYKEYCNKNPVIKEIQ